MIRTPEDFGHLIRERRNAARITQDELAARCGTSRSFIIDLEAGKPTVHLGKALVAAIELGINLGDVDEIQYKDVDKDEASHPALANLPRF